MQESSNPRHRRSEPAPSAAEIPSVGAVTVGKIKSVDLEPRSNGENDWQDEVPGAETVRPGR